LRPYGVILDGHLELGLEVLLFGNVIQEVRPHTGIPDDFVLSPAFVNAHSHLEYRHMLGKVQANDFPGWLREITRLKTEETPEQVIQACSIAARENRETGVGCIGEHSDRPGSAPALAESGLAGWIYQEVITIGDLSNIPSKLSFIKDKAEVARKTFGDAVSLSAHAPYTLDPNTLSEIGHQDCPLSIHVAETKNEKALFERGDGPLAAMFDRFGLTVPPPGRSLLDWLDEWGFLAPHRQFVHCCDLDEEDFERMAIAGVSVAHCPRSNTALWCPPAKVRRMIDAGLQVGLGLDSVASSGPIDMFAEMREALRVSGELGEPLTEEQVWNMATTMGYRTLGKRTESDWEIAPGSAVPLIGLKIEGAHSARDVVEQSTPKSVMWLS
jgi:cytosine/adenosine deaminase-related metal-dependent hydrolase